MAHKSNHANVKLKIVAEKPIIGHAIINVGSSRKLFLLTRKLIRRCNGMTTDHILSFLKVTGRKSICNARLAHMLAGSFSRPRKLYP